MKDKLTTAMKVVAVIVACLIFSLVATTLAIDGLASSNLMFALASGKELVGTVADKIEFRGTYRLIISVDGYDDLDYTCKEGIFSRYQIGDTVDLDVEILIK